MNPNSIGIMLECIDKKCNNWYPEVKSLLTFLDEPSDEHIFGRCFERDEVHAVLAADVSALQPVDLKTKFHKPLWQLIQKS